MQITLFSQKTILTLLRISLGLIFLWAFFDKLLGLGFSTTPDQSWLFGVSPTSGYLTHGVQGPLKGVYANLANNMVVDWLYMMGLLGVGAALVLGIGMKVAIVSGSLMMGLFYLSVFPPQHNPVIDEHVIYTLVLLNFWYVKADQWYGLGAWWEQTELVKKFPALR